MNITISVTIFAFIATLVIPLILVPSSSVELIPHMPIVISSDVEFTAENGIVSGSGTESDPYIIENWDIDTSGAHGISISNTSKYFIIRNVSVHGPHTSAMAFKAQIESDHAHATGKVGMQSTTMEGFDGLRLNHVMNGRVENSAFVNNFNGIYIADSDNNVFENNNVSNNANFGIELHNSSNNTIIANTVNSTMMMDGIWLSDGSRDNIVKQNIANFNAMCGIALTKSGTENNTIVDNTTNFNGLHGIQSTLRASNNIFIGNNSTANVRNGLFIWNTSGITIQNNTLQGNLKNGILVTKSDTLMLLYNTAIVNNGNGINLITSKDNTIQENTVNSNNKTGILIQKTNNTMIFKNTASSNSKGISITNSSNLNTVSENIAQSNRLYDLHWDGTGTGNIWIGNTFNKKTSNIIQ